MITPTVGRIVWFVPNQAEERGFRIRDDQPCMAFVLFAHDERKINALVYSHEGIPVFFAGIQLLQDNDPVPIRTERYCLWMPYQKGQAAKTEEIEKLLNGDK